MKKIIHSLIMLLGITSAWAGTGNGSQQNPYTGEWQTKDLAQVLKVGDHLAYDCTIACGQIVVYDTKLKEEEYAIVIGQSDWKVGDPINDDAEKNIRWKDYNDYCTIYNADLAERQQHTFIITYLEVGNIEYAMPYIKIKGYYSGVYYDRTPAGDGSEEHPYTGEWQLTDLEWKLKVGDHLSFNCVIKGGSLTIIDDKLDEYHQLLMRQERDWAVGDPIDGSCWNQYVPYCNYNDNLVERAGHTFIITEISQRYDNWLEFSGHYSGYYTPRGNGSQETPYMNEWQTSDLAKKLQVGDYLALSCVLMNGNIFVTDTELSKDVVDNHEDWAVGDPIDDTPWDSYKYYCNYNVLDERNRQMFLVTDIDRYAGNPQYLHVTGHYTGRYETLLPGYLEVRNYNELKTAIAQDNSAKILLVDDIYLNDSPELCNTFSGTIDGNGHIIYAGDQNAHHDGRGLAHGKYLFVYSDGATFRNLTFKDFRADTQEHSNWAILTSQARNKCVFENITFDHVSVFANYNNVGAAAGYAYDCTFTNIQVMNSDFTVDDNYAGAVVGDADKCTFTNIEVNSCESTAHDDCAGGVVGHSRNCTFQNVDVKNSFIQVNGRWVGGVAGTSVDGSVFANCVIDDQTCVYADGAALRGAYAGGVTGYADHGTFTGCINSAFINANEDYSGGIVGYATNNTQIENCLNTGMLTDLMSVKSEYYSRYKNPQPSECKTKRYNGTDYVVREIDFVDRYFDDGSAYGGIAGTLENSTVSRCTNLGYLNLSHATGGIVGNTIGNVTITDCLTDFTAFSSIEYSIKGLVGKVSSGTTTINNCINTTYMDYPNGSSVNATGLFSTQKGNKSEAQLASGQIGALLGGNWEQNLGTDPYPTPTGSKGLYHTRTVSNEYGTVCLPYAVQSDDDIHYYTFSAATDNEGVTELVFDYTDELPAGTPALFRVRNTGSTTFNAVAGGWTAAQSAPMATWSLCGTYQQLVFDGSEADPIYYISGGAIKHATKVTIAPFRAYFQGPSYSALTGSNNVKAVRIVLDGEADEVDAINLIYEDGELRCTGNGKTYNLQGIEVGDDYRGIVIRNGKTYMNK